MKRWSRSCFALAFCLAGLVSLTTGCSSTQAEPLDVTYYYLPG
jgi:hypothetical protein